MRLDLRGRILSASLVLIAGATAVAFAASRGLVEQATTSAIESDLRHRVALGLVASSTWPPLESHEDAWFRLCERLSHASGARVTIVRRDGVVLGDSGVGAQRIADVSNHLLRPEIQDALRTGIGIARRHSHTVGQDLLYLALPFGDARNPSGVLRMALTLDAIDREAAFVRRGIWLGALAAVLLALAIAIYASSWISKGSRELVAAAKHMTRGDLDTRLPQLDQTDLSELGHALQHLANELSGTMKTLGKERDWMSGILSRMREGVLMLDGEQHVRLVNPALREMLLLDENVVGRPLLDAVRHSDLKRLLDQVVREGAPGQREFAVNGLKPRRLLVRAAPLGVDRAVFAVVLDLTEIRQLQSLRKDFVDNVSHELRSPVSAIRSAAETLRDSPKLDSQSIDSFIAVIVRQSKRLGALVDDLIELSRIESHEFKVVLQPVDLSSAVDQALEPFRDRAAKMGQTLVLALAPALPRVLTDARALEHVLSNLLDNAVKYAGTGSLIRIRAEHREDRVRICIDDTGPGIAEEHLPRLFERFYRVDSGRSRDRGGTGLGLSIVKHLLDVLGAEIQVDSTLGVGSTFTFTLPIAPEVHEDLRRRASTSA